MLHWVAMDGQFSTNSIKIGVQDKESFQFLYGEESSGGLFLLILQKAVWESEPLGALPRKRCLFTDM